MLSEQMHTVMEEDRLEFRNAQKYICRKFDEDYAKALLRDNAERILKGEYLEGLEEYGKFDEE